MSSRRSGRSSRSSGSCSISTSSASSNKTTVSSAFNCSRARLNNLWSIWYCVGVLVFEIYLTAVSIQRFAAYISLPWPEHAQPYFELNAYVGFIGAAVVLMPFFVVAALLRVGNLANDGHQLGSAADVQVLDSLPNQPLGLIRNVWLHSGPTAPLLHLVSSFCLLLPKVLMQSQLIRHGFLPKDDLWRTDLDFMLTYKDRIVVLGFLASTNQTSPLGISDTMLEDGPERSRSESGGSNHHQNHQLSDNELVSPEFVNYAMALLVFAVRYPSVFWMTNKALGLLFSVQLVLNALQSLLAFTGFAVLYKLRSYGTDEFVPSSDAFLLSVGVALLLYVTYAMMLTASGSIVYLYAFQKYKTFVAQQREKHQISWRANSHTLWGYLSHCISLALLVVLALVSAPLTCDYMVVYRGSLDGAVLACVIGTVVHLFVWIVLWLFLTLKNHWRFRLDPSDGRLSRFLGCIDANSAHGDRGSASPLLVVSDGQTYVVQDSSPRVAILNIVEKLPCATGSGSGDHSSSKHHHARGDEDDDIYWLKPKPTVMKESSDSNRHQPSWLSRKKNSPSPKHKVMFDDNLLGGSPRRVRSATKSPKIGKLKKQNVKFEDLTDSDDDGDYATLRDLPLVQEENEDEEMINDEMNVDSQKDDQDTDAEADETQTLLLGDAVDIPISRSSPMQHVPVLVHPARALNGDHLPMLSTPQSVSSSPSPPGKCSETSSGIHSSSSISDNPSRRSSSVDEMHTVGLHNARHLPPGASWKSLSLQRTAQPIQGTGPVGSTNPTGSLGPHHYRRGVLQPQDLSPTSESVSQDSTLILRRKPNGTGYVKGLADVVGNPRRPEPPFGRATNVRMTSFTDQPDFPERIASWQKKNCHHAGVVANSPSPVMVASVKPTWAAHHAHQRDSANYSLTSSGDSDNYLSHQ